MRCDVGVVWEEEPMAGLKRIVLVHGAAHGAWCWERVVPLLEAKGYEVATLDLPGLGDDPMLPKDVTFDAYVACVEAAVRSGPEPVLLLGHSMGGAPISQAAENAREQVGKLVYLAAIMPKDGESMLDFRLDDPDSAARALRPSALEGAHDFDRAVAIEVFYHLCEPEVARAAALRLRPQASRPFEAKMHLTAGRWGAIAKTYVVCAQDRALPPAWQHRFCERAPEVKKHVMATDHSPFYSDAAGLAALIDEEAR
jgi:pimeloyl-ACP methyl ester carboxylesterase